MYCMLSNIIPTLGTDPCLYFFCQNGGKTERSGATCICRCLSGYTGPRCETSKKFVAITWLFEGPYSFIRPGNKVSWLVHLGEA